MFSGPWGDPPRGEEREEEAIKADYVLSSVMKRSFDIRPLSLSTPQPNNMGTVSAARFFFQDDDWAAVVEEEEDRKRVLGVEGQVWRWRWGEMDAIQFWRGNGQEKWAGRRKRIEEKEMSFPSSPSPNRFFHYSIREAPLSPEHNNAQIKILCPRTNRARPPLHYVNNSSCNFLRRLLRRHRTRISPFGK